MIIVKLQLYNRAMTQITMWNLNHSVVFCDTLRHRKWLSSIAWMVGNNDTRYSAWARQQCVLLIQRVGQKERYRSLQMKSTKYCKKNTLKSPIDRINIRSCSDCFRLPLPMVPICQKYRTHCISSREDDCNTLLFYNYTWWHSVIITLLLYY